MTYTLIAVLFVASKIGVGYNGEKPVVVAENLTLSRCVVKSNESTTLRDDFQVYTFCCSPEMLAARMKEAK